MATTIKLKNGSGAPTTGDLVQGEPAFDLTNKRLYTEDSGGAIIEIGTSPSTIDINAGTIDGTVIGGASAAALTATTITGTNITANSTVTINNDGGSSFSHSRIILDSNGANRAAGIFSHNQVNDTEWFFGNPYDTPDSFAINRQATASHNDSTSNKTNSLVTVSSSGNVGIGDATPSSGAGWNKFVKIAGGTSNAVVLDGTDSQEADLGASDGLYISVAGHTTGSNNNIIFRTQSANSNFTGAERMRIDSAGNVGIGTASPAATLDVKGSARIERDGSSTLLQFTDTGVNSRWIGLVDGTSRFAVYGTNGSTEEFVIDSSGNVGLGTTSPNDTNGFSRALDVNGVNGAALYTRTNGSTTNQTLFGNFGDSGYINNKGSGSLLFYNNNNTERMRIDSSGNLLVGKTSTTLSASGMMVIAGNSMTLTIASGTTYHLYDGSNYKFYVNANGGIYNYQANDVNLSDQRVKKDIVDSSNYLEKLCNIPVRNFRYNEDAENGKHHLGVIAQEVEVVAPEFVNKASWEHKDGPMDTVYNTDLMFAMMKSIQELSTQVTELKAEVAALKGE